MNKNFHLIEIRSHTKSGPQICWHNGFQIHVKSLWHLADMCVCRFTRSHIPANVSETFSFFLKCQLHTLNSWKQPNRTWGHQKTAFVWKKLWKNPNHKRNVAKRWFSHKSWAVTCPTGNDWLNIHVSVLGDSQAQSHKNVCQFQPDPKWSVPSVPSLRVV